MSKILKWFLAGFAFLIVGLVFFASISGAILYKTLPDANNKVVLKNLSASVEVIFDENAVPHIEADRMEDAMHALGYVHARDRLWQMEFLRRVGEGRLSEVLGEATLETDVFLRTLDMKTAAQKSYDLLLPETKAALKAYAAGINAYIQRPTDLFEAGLGVEFLILGHKPEPWEPWNSGLILKVMGLTLSKNLNTEIQRLALAARGMSAREIEEILPYGPRDAPPPLPDLRKLYEFPDGGKFIETTSATEKLLNPTENQFDWPTGRSASNNWVISGARTVSGKPILANDPHLGLTAPSVFYLAHMSWKKAGEKQDIVGGTLPGIPFVIAGRNANVAWGLTTTNNDSQDIFLEQINPEDPESYKIESGWEKFTEKEISILVSGGETQTLKRRGTRNGVVLPAQFKNIERYLPENTVAALGWTGLAEDDTSLDTLFVNGTAKNIDDIFEGMKRAVSPMQSVVVADIQGNIGLATPGRLVKRKEANIVKGRAPIPGWLDEYRWSQPIESKDVPTFANGDKGAYTTANANFLPADYPHHFTFDWAEHFRQARAERRVVDRDKPHDVKTSRSIMKDDFSAPLLELIKTAARQAKAGVGKSQNLLQAMVRWDGRMRADRAEPLVAMALFRHLHKNVFSDELGEDYSLFDRGRITRLLNVMTRGTSRNWCDDVSTAKIEQCGEMVTKSLREAVDELESRNGNEWRDWKYGDEHLAFSEHRPFGSIAPLAGFFNILKPSSGGPYTLLRGQTYFGKDNPYRNRHAAAYRAIYDFSDLEASIFMISTGQSGNFLSPYYSNLAPQWAKSDFIQVPTIKENYQKGKIGTWVFIPE